jgi:hypothetical protein
MYGAIAYSPQSNSWAYSHNYSNQMDAENAACREAGLGSVIVAWAYDAYAALAISDNGVYAGGVASSRSDAEFDALNQCTVNGGDDCRIVCYVYSG